MKNVLITGGHGQLASSIKVFSKGLQDCTLIYKDVDELDITSLGDLRRFFKEHAITHCVNCAAYTAVDEAEKNAAEAELINVRGVQNLARICTEQDTVLIHISTDFVFSGKQSVPYVEDDPTDPLGVYGRTKRDGEIAAIKGCSRLFIIRTSWLYSEFGNNFMKSMLRLGSEKEQLNIIYDQVGTPTYAADLAGVILKIIDKDIKSYGIYHYSNEGVTSWYDFAKAIFEAGGIHCNVNPIRSREYPTPAKRPSFSVMDKSKIKRDLSITIPYWKDSLKECLKKSIIKN